MYHLICAKKHCVFISRNSIKNILASKKQLYCAFIDYQRCVDTVLHEALWQELVQLGISSKYINRTEQNRTEQVLFQTCT